MAMQFKKNLLNLAVCTAVTGLSSGMVFAQETQEVVDEIVVLGMKSSIVNAQDIKRNADTVKDVITASDIGALPDKSVTEALQRVPGVTIERFASSEDPNHFADEGTGVLVRGLDRVRSEINGRDAFSANPWGGLSYEDFSPELLGSVEVVKNQTADLISGGIAGTVNLITLKPFDSADRKIAFSAKANYGDFREEVTPAFSALFSDRWETGAGEFGFLLAGSHSQFETRGDGVGVANYYSRGDAFLGTYDQWGSLARRDHFVGPNNFDGPCGSGMLWDANCAANPSSLITEDAESPLEGPALPGQPAGSVYYAPGQYSLRTAENDRERTGLTTSLQWQNTDETIVATLEHIRSEASLEWRERVIGPQGQGFSEVLGYGINWAGTEEQPLTFSDDGYLTSGIINSFHPEMPTYLSSRWNYNESTVEDTSLNVQLKPLDELTVTLDYQHVDSEQIVHNYGMNARTNPAAGIASAYLDLRGSNPKIEFLNERFTNPGVYQAADWSDGSGTIRDNADLFIGTGIDQEAHSNAKADSFKIDVDYELEGVWTAIKGGVYYSDKELIIRDTEYSNWGAIGTPWVRANALAASTVEAPELFEAVDFSDYYNGDVLQGEGSKSFLFPKMSLVENFAESLRQGCEDGWNNTPAGGNTPSEANSGPCHVGYEDLGNRIPGSVFAAHDITSSNEKRTEAYIRADFAFDDLAVPIKGNIGLRYVNYQLESTGFLVLPPASTGGVDSEAAVFAEKYPELREFASGESFQSTVEGTDYDTVLPSLNLAFSLHDDVVMRFGASQGLYFPSLTDTRNSMILSLGYDTVLQDSGADRDEDTNPVVDIINPSINAVARNPYLEPEEAINLDLSTEWYFADAGSVSVGLFHKELDNIIRERSFDLDVYDPTSDLTLPVSAFGPANTGSGTIRGIEFSYSQFYDFLPGALSGLGVQFNYTYIDQNGLDDPEGGLGEGIRFTPGGVPIRDDRNSFRAFTGLPLQGYSDENMNLVGMYEYNDISFRLAYTWRSEYLVTRRDSNEFAPIYAEAAGYLDSTLYYTINENWKIGLEASNLLDTETKTKSQVNQEGRLTDSLSFDTDRRYAISLRANF